MEGVTVKESRSWTEYKAVHLHIPTSQTGAKSRKIATPN